MWQETKRIFVESAGHVLQAAARLLPSVLAMFLLFALVAVLAVATRAVVRRVCDRLGLDRRLRQWGVAAPDADAGASPTRLVARVSFWTVLVIGVFLGVSVLDAPAASALSMRFLDYAPRLLVAIVILGVGMGIARVVQRNVLIGAVNMGMQSARLFALGGRWLVVLLGAAIALEHAGLGASVVTVAFGILFGGIVLALAIAVGLGSKDLVARSLQRRFPEPGTPEARRAEQQEEERGRLHHL
jgi:mechanosensitive ion channel-like protein